MSQKLSCIITDFLISRRIITDEKRKLLIYGYDALFNIVFKSVCIILIGIAFGYSKEMLVYILVLITLRVYVGGYHSQSRIGCNIVSVLSSVALIVAEKIVKCIEADINYRTLGIVVVVYMAIFMLYAPVVKKQKQYTKQEIEKIKKNGLIVSCLYMIAALFLIYYGMASVAVAIMYSLMLVAIMLILGK